VLISAFLFLLLFIAAITFLDCSAIYPVRCFQLSLGNQDSNGTQRQHAIRHALPPSN
jgi:hypothetical protein